MIEYKKPRYNVHFRISTMPNGFMVLDYDATPEMGNIYADEKHGYQMVIRDVSRAEARRVCNVLNEKDDAIIRLEEENKKLKEKIQLLQIELNADAKQYQIFIDIIDEADDLICSHLSKHYQRKWRTFCKNKEYDFE